MAALAAVVGGTVLEERQTRLKTMVGAMMYGERAKSGRFSLPRLGLEIGWAYEERGGEMDASVVCDDGELALIICGELVGGNDLRQLTRRYRERGSGVIRGLNGSFSGILVDGRSNECLIFNDRYGMKRLFAHQATNSICVASEAKALLAAFPETRDFDPRGVGEFVAVGCTLGERSLFRGVTVVPGGSVWTIDAAGTVTKRNYFDRREWENQSGLSEEQFSDRFQNVFPTIVKRHSRASAPVGVSLTGGLDSRMIMSCLDNEPGLFPCYTFGSKYRDTFDVAVAREVASVCNQTHTTLTLDDEFLKEFPRQMEQAVYCSDGYIGMSGAAELFLNRQARRVAPIRLTGNYGGELLRRVRAFGIQSLESRFMNEGFRPFVREACEAFKKLSSLHPVSFSLFCQVPDQGYGRRAVEESQVVLRTPFLDNDLACLAYRAPGESNCGSQVSTGLIARMKPTLLKVPTDRGDLGRGTILTRVLRRAYREGLFKGEYWASHGMPSWSAALIHRLPMLSPESYLLGRHKFQHFRRWLGENAATFVRDISSSDALPRDYVDRRRFRRMVEDHLVGRCNYLKEIDAIVSLTLVKTQFFSPSRVRVDLCPSPNSTDRG
jgi:asparagine synthase (glutamine-hydrolysing)